jgi:cell division septum initiation protein DivIVA
MTPDDALPTGEASLSGVLDALERAIEHGRTMPMSTSVLVNRTELLHLLAQARAVVPEQIGAADEVLAEADGVRRRARADAERILADARARAAEVVSTDAVVVAAREQAAAIVADAEATAERLRREADDYCDRRLADFEIDLGRVLAQVQAGRAKLAGRLGED